jgi:hypothetical protein
MAERFDPEIEEVITMILSPGPVVIEDGKHIEAVLDAADIYHLFRLQVGGGKHVIAEPRRYGTLTMSVHPTSKAYEHRGLPVPADIEC